MLLSGEVTVFKNPVALFQGVAQVLDAKLNYVHSPQDSNTELFGVAVGSLMAPCLLCEDSIFFKQPMLCLLQVKSKVLVWRCPQ